MRMKMIVLFFTLISTNFASANNSATFSTREYKVNKKNTEDYKKSYEEASKDLLSVSADAAISVDVNDASVDLNIQMAEFDSKICVQSILDDGTNLWKTCEKYNTQSALWFYPKLLKSWEFNPETEEWNTTLNFMDSKNPAVISNLQPGIYKIYVYNPSSKTKNTVTFKIDGVPTYKASIYFMEDFSSGDNIRTVPMISFSPLNAGIQTKSLNSDDEPIRKDFEKIKDHFTGNPEGRFNILFMGDFITEERMPMYRRVVEEFKTEFFNTEPYKSYSNYINLISVNVISPPGERYINIYSTGNMHKGRAPQLKRYYFNKADIVAVKVSGGAPGRDITVIGVYGDGYALNAGHAKVMMHEFGHHHGFADNYTAGETSCFRSGPNVSSTSSPSRVPWREWLQHGTRTLSANSCGRYQSSDNGNMMRSANSRAEYGAFLHEQILVDLYRKNFNLITSYTPEGVVSNFRQIDVEPMRPVSHEFDIFWTANGKEINPANPKMLVRSDLKGFSGTVDLEVKVVDPTELVKSERFRDELMTKTLNWTVNLNDTPAPEPPTNPKPEPPTNPNPEPEPEPEPKPPANPPPGPIFDPVGKYCSYKHWPHGRATAIQKELLYQTRVTRHLRGRLSTEPCPEGEQGTKTVRTFISQVITCKLNKLKTAVVLGQIARKTKTEEVKNTCQ